ncbi:cytochrome c3 family protein [Microscilla marina]|uniref:Cytochrome c3 n=1 Tax=Microscilla marina ATCC 23134 TaxID=313606 RepID=A1ZL70_MICM2|nr:cytochrome c3 family protein [Microscilla marina]EAY29036.1 cytochrome c3 [Microscilla marina ATCC 23134]
MFSKNRLNYLKYLSVWAFALLLIPGALWAQDSTKTGGGGDVEAGKTLFDNNCQQCHSPGADVIVGPGLKGIMDRRSMEWLIPWVKNSAKVIASGDPYAVKLYNKYNKTAMQSFNLSDEEIKNIFAYVQAYKPGGNKDEQTTPGQTTANAGGGQSNYFNLVLGVLVFVLILILAVLFLIISVLRRYLNQQENEGKLDEEDKEILHEKFNIGKVLRHPALLGGVAAIFLLVFAQAGLDTLLSVGVQQGYAPTQPIPFSHKLHAGQYEIGCEYCHTGVRKGKNAGIPSANICMNCHNAVKQGSPSMQKIYAAIENNKPIEWVRVHNLQDFAYFNHSQHTVVGGIECETCHGEIKEMEVVQQQSPLTMGWCIDCHRKTVVEGAKDKGDGKAKNAYYDRLLEIHQKDSKKPITVENIGGLECGKCHY